jgi:hypothetical protein
LNREVRDNLTELGVRRGVKLTRTLAFGIPNNSATAISWTAETADTDGFIAVTATTVTIPAGLGGIYAIAFSAVWAGAPGSAAWMGIQAGGVNYRQPAGIDLSVGMSITTDLVATTGTIIASLYQNSGGTVNMTGALTVFRLGL